MIWIALYVGVAAVISVAAFLLVEWCRKPGVAASRRPGLLAVATGLLWPVLLLGAAQWGVVAAAHWRRHGVGQPRTPVGAS